MATTRLDMAVKNYSQMNQMVERYTRLCRAYVRLSERFQELDVAHMTLKQQVVPLLQAYKAQRQRQQQQAEALQTLQATLETLKLEHAAELQSLIHTYEAKIQTLTQEVESLLPLQQEVFPQEAQEALDEAESQAELLEETFREMAADDAPDLSPAEKQLLAEFRANPSLFEQAVYGPAAVEAEAVSAPVT